MLKEMYRTIGVTELSVDGITYAEGKPVASTILHTVVGTGISESKIMGMINEPGFYPAVISESHERTVKCTMSESTFIANADSVESRFVGGRTKMVTRNVKTFSAICMEYDVATSEMKTVHYSLPCNMPNDKALAILKKNYEEPGKTIICTVTDIVSSEGIYAMTEEKFYRLAERKEIV